MLLHLLIIKKIEKRNRKVLNLQFRFVLIQKIIISFVVYKCHHIAGIYRPCRLAELIQPKSVSLGLAWIWIFRRVDFVWLLMSNSEC